MVKGNERDQNEGDRSVGTGTVHVFGGETENVTDKNRFLYFENLLQSRLCTIFTVFTGRNNKIPFTD